jgi:hypothetical protein
VSALREEPEFERLQLRIGFGRSKTGPSVEAEEPNDVLELLELSRLTPL